MNTEEANTQMQKLADNCITDGDVMEKVQKLSIEERNTLIYRLAIDEMYDDIRCAAIDMSYLWDELGLVNDYEKQVSKPAQTMGMLNLGVTMIMQVFAKQARHEMQAQTGDTQWGMQLADAINDKAIGIQSELQELTTLVCHYQACLVGRRMGIHFLDEDGASKAIEYKENTD